MMKLYHVSYGKSKNKAKLYFPKVPETMAPGENNTIPRICLADSIEHCIQADQGPIRRGQYFTIYHIEIEETDPNLIWPHTLREKEWVMDAVENHEYWYTKAIEMPGEVYRLKSYQKEKDVAWTALTLGEVQKEVKKCIEKYELTISESELNEILAVETTNVVYEKFMEWLKENKLMKAARDFKHEINILPWADITKIKNVEMEKVES